MEVVVESVPDHQSIDDIKLNEVSEKPSSEEVKLSDHKSNGVAESGDVVPDSSEGNDHSALVTNIDAAGDVDSVAAEVVGEATELVSTSEAEPIVTEDNTEDGVTAGELPAETTAEAVVSDLSENIENNSQNIETVNSESKDCQLTDIQMEEVVESEVIEPSNDNVRFETEILVETNDNEVNDVEIENTKVENDSPNNILSELGQSIELSEVLRSSDVTENVENNNCPIRQEVFNKEELLDILEGNDVQSTGNQDVDISHNATTMEAHLAMQQISRLKNNRKNRHTPVKEKKVSPNKEENIVNALVKDWDDDEPADEQAPKAKEQSSKSELGNVDVKQESTVDSSTGDNHTADLNKSSDDGQPQRRLGRVIKKKVIFDPDNPETYTKSKSLKNKETENEKDLHQPKKAKLDQMSVRAKSKSPISKMQWKKPPPKNIKQNKRLSEVDKLLMDEGAVNMIYQLTPEAPKGKKNMKTKAEFIKKLQSSTPEGKEMKFRERKKELLKGEDGEPKKILGGKHRSSLSSSVKSPSVSEDFETHSADDSIIYRRHSSSSYSSSCMSPRRLSDVETSQLAVNSSQTPKADLSCGDAEPANDVFQPDSSVCSEIINKDDCLSIKKKLNSKLSLALNKRKRESGKTDKPIKKKVIKPEATQEKGDIENYKYLSLTVDQRVAEIYVRKSGSNYKIEVLKEIAEALSYVDARKDISVTLLTSECGGLCSDLDLTSLLDEDADKRNQAAAQIAESIRSVLSCAEQHSKVLCCGVWAACSGLALALLAPSDVALAAERAAFTRRAPVSAGRPAPPAPALAALRASARVPNLVINEMVIFGRELSAAEALQYGLVNRVLWPGGVENQIQAIVKDLATQPPQELVLKKKLLKLGRSPESTFLSQLENELSLLVEYWTSREGQAAIQCSA